MRKTALSLLLSSLSSLICIGSAHAAEDSLQVPACTVPSQSVRASGYLPVNGIDQWVTVAGADCHNPVILFVHGGPGNFGILRRFDCKYEALVTDPAPKQWWQPAALYATPAALADA